MSQTSNTRLDRGVVAFFLSVIVSTLLFCSGASGEIKPGDLVWSTDSTSPARFVSVHGRRAAIFGYSQDGLEVWAYPFQMVSSYKVSFHPQGVTTAIDGQSILRRIIYSPESVTRIYAGPDFVIRERIFVPLEDSGAIIRYEVQSVRPIDIDIHFIPVLDLMWPGGIGGQEALWHAADSAYVLSEPTRRFSGSIGSPNIVAHDDTPNQNRQLVREAGLGFTIRAGGEHSTARVIIAGGPERTAIDVAKRLEQNEDSLEKVAADHYSTFLNDSLQIETPDQSVNRSLAWSEVALDQAWVCNPDLGCGLAAGYGPSRKVRRPQYDWFFAGDGMVDLPALLAAGEFERARQELEFILKYQDQKTGMIWHELSQSAGWMEWSKYPYMFVHVELTFDFLNSVEDYVTATGDRAFVSEHWPAIQSAYEYCRFLVDPKDGLPRIPAGKQGAREQEQLTEELAMSASWIAASRAFADLAVAAGHNSVAGEAIAASEQAAKVIRNRYWDEKQNFWITGYTRSGSPLSDRQIGPVSILAQGLFSDAQRDSILHQLEASDYQTDWGTRGRASTASTYDPNSYANGSVWAISTSEVARAFWSAHRPTVAFPIWDALVPWSSLDSLGHMHETLAGDYYHEEFESVPEQTWSSATFFNAVVSGLLGLKANGVSNSLSFAPHLPASWNSITLRHLRVGSSEISLELVRSLDEIRLQVHNEGGPTKIVFDPEIPLGAKLRGAHLQNHSVAATLEAHPQDSHARVQFELPDGDSLLTIDYTGGVQIEPELEPPAIGDSSRGIKITGASLNKQVYTVGVDYVPSASNTIDLRTSWTIVSVEGAEFQGISPGNYRLRVPTDQSDMGAQTYRHSEIRITFAEMTERHHRN